MVMAIATMDIHILTINNYISRIIMAGFSCSHYFLYKFVNINNIENLYIEREL
jgi:hypothetical protein